MTLTLFFGSDFEDSGISSSDRFTNDKQFFVSLSGGTSANVTYQISADAGLTWTNAGSSFSNIADGSYKFRAYQNTLPAGLASGSIKYLASTGHYYEYVPGTFTWAEARDAAASRTFNGATGYLATIISAEENTFIANLKADADWYLAWIGASDADTEGVWKWMTGPEAGTVFWNGGTNGSAPAGQYANWPPGEQPDNHLWISEGEDFGHMWANGYWNDLSPLAYPSGYFVEYGGLPTYSNELSVTIDATAPIAPILALASDAGISNSDGITNNGTVNVTGLEAGASWQYSTDSGSSWLAGTGTSFVLSSGSYSAGSIQVRQSDVAGNTSANSQLGTITIDNSAPSAAVLLNVTETRKDPDSTDYITDLRRPTVILRVEVGASIQVSPPPADLSNYYWIQEEILPGLYSIYADEDLRDGTYTFTVVDAAGNKSTASQAITVDTTGPVITGIIVSANSIDLAFSESLSPLATDVLSRFAISLANISRSVSSPQFLNNERSLLRISLSSTTTKAEQDIRIIYTDLTADNDVKNVLQDLAGNDLATFSSTPPVLTYLSNLSSTGLLADSYTNLILDGNSNINGTGNNRNNIIAGNAGNNSLDGGAGNDTIYGESGSDTLDGGTGIDSLIGGSGDDIYVVDSVADVVTESSAEGNDLVRSAVTYAIQANVENLTLTGTGAINGTGNSANNLLSGNSGNNSLNGGAGNDTVFGGAGSDTLDGGTGVDSLSGGLGDDTYVVDSIADIIAELTGEGTDLIRSSVTYSIQANVENLTLTGTGAINGTGNSANNLLSGNSGNNSLNGGAGNDTVFGGAGKDTLDGGTGDDSLSGGLGADIYVVDSVADVITELSGEGTDLVQSSVTYAIQANIENLTLTGTGAIRGTGNTLNNILAGNTGNNSLDGGAGIDTLIGGAGDDTYIVDSITDVITEAVNAGSDTVASSVTFSLAAIANVENLSLTGTASIRGTGNSLDNTIIGNSGSNQLNGGAG